MTVKLLHNTPLWVCSTAIRKCWSSEEKSDTEFEYYCPHGDMVEKSKDDVVTGDKDKELIYRIGNKNKHSSTLEHLNYSFDVDGISRACLQELARHRIASYSVKSTRYTLKELKNIEIGTLSWEEIGKFVVLQEDAVELNGPIYDQLIWIHKRLNEGWSNDKVKYMLPEAYKTSLVMTINARALQNFLALRTFKSALWEIRDLANEIFSKLPEEHTYLFEECISKD